MKPPSYPQLGHLSYSQLHVCGYNWSNDIKLTSERYTPEALITSFTDSTVPFYTQQLANKASLETVNDTAEDNFTDERAVSAKHKPDPDILLF